MNDKVEFEIDSPAIPQYDPALAAVQAVNKTMDIFEPIYGSKWLTQELTTHAKHALDHAHNVMTFMLSQPDGYYAKAYDLVEELEHLTTRTGMMLWLISQQKEASEEAPSVAQESVDVMPEASP